MASLLIEDRLSEARILPRRQDVGRLSTPTQTKAPQQRNSEYPATAVASVTDLLGQQQSNRWVTGRTLCLTSQFSDSTEKLQSQALLKV
jgi:hypothetical protein